MFARAGWHLLLFGLVWVGLTLGVSADTTSFLQAETQILRQERTLHELAKNLEEWLAGRLTKTVLLERLGKASKDLKSCHRLPAEQAEHLLRVERDVVSRVEVFASLTEPDGKAQRELFLALGRLHEQRTTLLLDWRASELTKLIAESQQNELHSHYRWELSWLPLWKEEAALTRTLQENLLEDSGDSSSHRKVLQDLLKLRRRATLIATPEQDQELQKLSLERLVILARTAEQLLRLEKRKSRGALTRVRRLSKRLSALTKEYQEKRLEVFQDMVSKPR